MKPIYQSATKIVLIMFALGVVTALFTGHISEETFKTSVLMVLTYYFTKAQGVKEANLESGNSDIVSTLEGLKHDIME